nr:hypothetical protein [Nostoc sphaeroides]
MASKQIQFSSTGLAAGILVLLISTSSAILMAMAKTMYSSAVLNTQDYSPTTVVASKQIQFSSTGLAAGILVVVISTSSAILIDRVTGILKRLPIEINPMSGF